MTRDGRTSEEVLGDQTSYTYQLARLAEALRGGRPFPTDIDGSVANAELIDECYRRAGIPPGKLTGPLDRRPARWRWRSVRIGVGGGSRTR